MKTLGLGALCAALLLTASAFAGPVNTGSDGMGGLISLGAVDSNFLLFPSTCCGSGLNVNAFPSSFLTGGAYPGASALSNTATAEWIGYTGFGPHWAGGSNATAAFSETFTLSSGDIAAGNLDLSGLVGMTGTYDEIVFNGHVDTADSFAEDFGASLHSFDISSGFQAGTNTLSFVETWPTALGTTYGSLSTGVIVDDLELSGGSAPEPATFALLGGSAVILGLIRRRKPGSRSSGRSR